jgi:hypothetical protein
MRFVRHIQRRLRRQGEGVDLRGDLNAVVAANVGERGAVTRASQRERQSSTARTRTTKEASDG